MSTLQATWALYKDSAIDAFKGTARSVWGVTALLLAFVVFAAVAVLVTPMGLAGGFILGFLEAALAGWYLSLVEIGVDGARRVRLSDLRDAVGHYLWEVISVLFIFFIAELLLQGFGGGTLLLVAVPLATLLFNPAPEMIYQDRLQSFALLGDAVNFMQRNWPEWLGGQLIGAGFLAGWSFLVYGMISPYMVLELVQAYGPWFGFIHVGGQVLGSLGVGSVIGAAAMLVFTHWFMLFRGQLYKRLRHSSRRSRAWRSRF